MNKREHNQIDGHDLWDIEAAFYVNKHAIDPDKARTLVILRWLWHGDARPLAASIEEGHPLDQAVLNLLGRLTASQIASASAASFLLRLT
jgi:hypothetical protein